MKVLIQVRPIADIEFPKGTGFSIRIPDYGKPTERTMLTVQVYLNTNHIQIPFTVIGNAWTTVVAEPGELTRASGGITAVHSIESTSAKPLVPERNLDLNKITKIPYKVWVEFPKHDALKINQILSTYSDENPTLDTSVRANVANGPVSGVIHVVPNIIWGESARRNVVLPGIYRGNVQVTISASEG